MKKCSEWSPLTRSTKIFNIKTQTKILTSNLVLSKLKHDETKRRRSVLAPPSLESEVYWASSNRKLWNNTNHHTNNDEQTTQSAETPLRTTFINVDETVPNHQAREFHPTHSGVNNFQPETGRVAFQRRSSREATKRTSLPRHQSSRQGKPISPSHLLNDPQPSSRKGRNVMTDSSHPMLRWASAWARCSNSSQVRRR